MPPAADGSDGKMVVGPLDVIEFAIQTGSMQMINGSNVKQYVDNIPYPFAASASDDKANAEYLMQGINIFCLKKAFNHQWILWHL